MAYLTLLQLADTINALELAQVASPSDARVVDAALMDATLRDGDRSGYEPDAVAVADAAKARIEAMIGEASDLIDGYIGGRYTLPLTTTPGILVTWARAITRYKLHGDRRSGEDTDPIVRDYKDALRGLVQVADGKFSLGVQDPVAQGSGDGAVNINPGVKVFGREVLP